VVALHFGLAVILIVGVRVSTRSPAGDFVSTLILPPTPLPAPESARQRPPPDYSPAPITPVEPLIALPDVSSPNAPSTSIDWDTEAKRAAGAATGESSIRQFGRNPAIPYEQQKSGPTPAHEPGEQYRLGTGEWIVWVTPGCYIVSDVPPLGLPDVLARSIPTRTVCQDNSKPPGELFKELPAYKKYHPQ
jgi:hypothetical protein